MLINCSVYEAGNKIADLTLDEISPYLKRSGCFVWLALVNPTPEEFMSIKQYFSLHELAIEDAQHGHQRPKLEEYEDTVFSVMHLVEILPDGEMNVGEINVFVAPNFIITARKDYDTDSFIQVRKRCESSPALLSKGSGFVFYALMDTVVDQYFPILDAFESELDLIERKIFTNTETVSARNNIENLYELKHKIMQLKHSVAPLLESASKLYGARAPIVAQSTADYFRDVIDHLARLDSTVDALRDMISTAIQANLTLVTIEDSAVTKKLAAWAGLFGVATALAGLWGMNFKHMPELSWRYGYPVALAIIVVVCGWLYCRFKKSGWL